MFAPSKEYLYASYTYRLQKRPAPHRPIVPLSRCAKEKYKGLYGYYILYI